VGKGDLYHDVGAVFGRRESATEETSWPGIITIKEQLWQS
jgi:hypothetical protein